MSAHDKKIRNYAWRTKWENGHVQDIMTEEKNPGDALRTARRMGTQFNRGKIVDCHLVPLEALNKPTPKKDNSVEHYEKMTTEEILDEVLTKSDIELTVEQTTGTSLDLGLYDKDKNVEMYKKEVKYINNDQDYELVGYVAEIQGEITLLSARADKLFEFISDGDELYDNEFLAFFTKGLATKTLSINICIQKILENLEGM